MNDKELLALHRSFHILGDRHVLKILYQLDSAGEQTFSQLRDELHINPRTLSQRLKLLDSTGFVIKDESRENLRVFYRLEEHQKNIKRMLDAYERLAYEL